LIFAFAIFLRLLSCHFHYDIYLLIFSLLRFLHTLRDAYADAFHCFLFADIICRHIALFSLCLPCRRHCYAALLILFAIFDYLHLIDFHILLLVIFIIAIHYFTIFFDMIYYIRVFRYSLSLIFRRVIFSILFRYCFRFRHLRLLAYAISADIIFFALIISIYCFAGYYIGLFYAICDTLRRHYDIDIIYAATIADYWFISSLHIIYTPFLHYFISDCFHYFIFFNYYYYAFITPMHSCHWFSLRHFIADIIIFINID